MDDKNGLLDENANNLIVEIPDTESIEINDQDLSTEDDHVDFAGVQMREIQSFHREDDEQEFLRTLSPLVVQADQDSAELVKIEPLRTYQSQQQHYKPTPDGTAMEFTYYSPTIGKLEAQTLFGLARDFGGLVDLLKSQNYFLDICNPSPSDMAHLAQIFNIHPLSTEDIETDSTREKCEMFKSYLFICYCALDPDPESHTFMQSFNVYILVFKSFVLSFHYCPFSSMKKVVRRLDALKSYTSLTPHWINYSILDDITDKYTPIIRSVELEVETIDDLVFVISGSEQSDMLRRIANARKRVNALQKLLVAKADVIRVVMKRLESTAAGLDAVSDNNGASSIRDTVLYLSDVQDHVITMVQSLTHIDLTLNRSHSNYLAQINIEITQSSNNANDAMTKLTAVASILVPLNVITGLFGMNVNVPGQTEGPGGNLGWFFGIIVSMIVISALAYVFVRRSGLMGKMYLK